VYDRGDLIPDWFPIFLFEEKLFQLGEGDGLILDGAVRTIGQAERFHEVASWFKRDYLALDIQVSDEEVIDLLRE